jgi:hypothetical protein
MSMYFVDDPIYIYANKITKNYSFIADRNHIYSINVSKSLSCERFSIIFWVSGVELLHVSAFLFG